jgi:hypothetical protein
MPHRSPSTAFVPAVLAALTVLCALAAPRDAAAQLPIRWPDKAFGELPHPPPPDYAQARSWAALPDRLDAGDVVPENDPFGDRQAVAQVDVFYIHPTTYREIEYWNQPLDDAKTNDWTDESVIARQAAVFNACCRVFAPRYRQASSAGVYAPPELKAIGAYDFAWADVRAAFLHYMKHWNGGRPFIIAGHSQGAAHTQRWLEEFGTQAKFRAKLVAAYPIGIAFTEGQLRVLGGGIRVCATPADTGCLVTWNAFDRAGDPSGFVRSAQDRWAKKSGSTADATVACVNPLTFDLARPEAPASWNLGALPARRGVGLPAALQSGTRLPATEAGGIGGACEGGVVRVGPLPAAGYAIVPLPAGMLHFNDFDLFYQNIRINAVTRSEAFLDARRTRR